MATFAGKSGVARIGANAFAEVVSWSVEQTADPIEDTELSDEWKTFKSGTDLKKGWTFTVECHFDDTDTNGQETATIGASISLELYPEGTTTGDYKLSGSGVVENVSITVGEGIVGRTISGTGTGALTEGTAS